jgi:hypothetical protein
MTSASSGHKTKHAGQQGSQACLLLVLTLPHGIFTMINLIFLDIYVPG